MVIKSVSLQHFRNFETVHINLNKGLNIFYGANAQGKTNFLESIYVCATGRSHRTHLDKELIHFEQKESHIQLFTQHNTFTDRLDMHIKKEGKKGVAINGIPIRKMNELFGVLYAVIFSPEDLMLVKAGPTERRRFVDMEICQLSATYCFDLQQYYKILKQRNHLLKQIKNNHNKMDELSVWNHQLVQYGTKVYYYRKEFIEKMSQIAEKIHKNMTNNKEMLNIFYKPNVLPHDYLSKLNKQTDRDIVLGTTSTGIHKDDLNITIEETDARSFGSQGQQRTAALSLKLAEIELIQQEKNENPILLLDDVLSELDETRQSHLFKSIQNIQTIITCTGLEDVLSKMPYCEQNSLFFVEEGVITKIHKI